MVYFRVLPKPLNDLDDDFIYFFFEFANTYTEDSILTHYCKQQADKEKEVSEEDLKELGYSDEDLLTME